MRVRIPALTPASLLVLPLVLSWAAAACDDSHTRIVATLNPTPLRLDRVSVQPATLVPEFLATPSCLAFRPFDLRLNLVVQTDRALVLHALRFELVDRRGGRSFPVPVPTQLPFNGIPPATPFPLTLRFDCGVHPAGTLVIDMDTASGDGATSTSRITAQVGG